MSIFRRTERKFSLRDRAEDIIMINLKKREKKPTVSADIPRIRIKRLFIDTDAALNGYISVTPITLDRTDYDALEKLSGRRK